MGCGGGKAVEKLARISSSGKVYCANFEKRSLLNPISNHY
jgi:hypothetical protein